MREKIKKFLIKYPKLLPLMQKIWWQISFLNVKLCGTSYLEKQWRNKKFNDFSTINHPHRTFLIEKNSNCQPFSSVLLSPNRHFVV